MAEGRRARADQVAKRINTAVEFLAGGMPVIDATTALARRHRLSQRQARRYVERARDEGAIEVPGPKVVFTVKLPAVVVRQIRRAARATGQSISAVVAQALGEFLERDGRRGGGSD
jgi:DNA-binding transcriptional regulator LsrR (DeoR family)